MQERTVVFSETIQYSSFINYLSDMFRGWRRWLMVTLWGLPVTLAGIYSLFHSEFDAPPLGDILPWEQWIIILLLWVFFLVALAFLLLGANSYRKMKIIQTEASHKVKNMDILHKYYGDRMVLPQLLFDLNKCCSDIINRQRIPRLPRGKMKIKQGLKILRAMLSILFRANIFKFGILMLLNAIAFGNPRILTKIRGSLSISILSNTDLALYDYKLGSIPASKNKEYIAIYEQIKTMEIGMPPAINGKINKCIRVLNSINCLILIRPERNYWKDIALSRITRRPLTFLTVTLDDIQSQLIGEISQDIRNFLGVG